MNDRVSIQHDWVAILIAIVLAYTILRAIRSGEITPLLYGKYTRSKDPISFWISIAVYLIFAVGSLLSVFVSWK